MQAEQRVKLSVTISSPSSNSTITNSPGATDRVLKLSIARAILGAGANFSRF